MTHVLKHNNKPLQLIKTKLDELHEFNRLLANHLPPEMTRHCQVVNIENNCLIVLVENGHWATQLRFHIQDLLPELRQYPCFEKLSGICCKTRPSPVLFKSFPLKKRMLAFLKDETAKYVLDIAKTIRDGKLREIIERIGRRKKM